MAKKTAKQQEEALRTSSPNSHLLKDRAWVKLDLGCGTKKQENTIGIDNLRFPGVDIVHDLSVQPWPLPDSCVDEAFSSHFVEHLSGPQRVIFFNELFRVMKPGAKATIVAPDWSNACAYGDPTHAWPPVSPWMGLYTNKTWRTQNAPHVDRELAPDSPIVFTCDFDWTNGSSTEEWVQFRHQEAQGELVTRNINAARDIVFTFVSRKPVEKKEEAAA